MGKFLVAPRSDSLAFVLKCIRARSHRGERRTLRDRRRTGKYNFHRPVIEWRKQRCECSDGKAIFLHFPFHSRAAAQYSGRLCIHAHILRTPEEEKMFREKLQLRQSSFTFGFRFKTILIINLYENRFLVLLKQKLSALEIRSALSWIMKIMKKKRAARNDSIK